RFARLFRREARDEIGAAARRKTNEDADRHVLRAHGQDAREHNPNQHRTQQHHSPRTPVSRITRPHAACPVRIIAANSSGELPITKMRAAFSAAATFSSFSAFIVSEWMRAMAAFGVPAGASKPYQNGRLPASKPSIPCAAMLLTPGSSSICSERYTATAFNLPLFTCGSVTVEG